MERSWRQMRNLARQTIRSLGVAAVLGTATVVQLAGSGAALAREPMVVTADSLGTVSLASLPPEAQQTERLVRAGGPFPFDKDGVTFGNRERRLPSQARGYYREYTVPTPHAKNRGARRLVCGGRQPQQPEACFYTDDHYASFRRLVP
ncbi:MAG TPA: ribonuclease [Ideonella sp.]|nr:ribonuclease [Ideonella sp.]HSI51996.1 ribonuclease [Ideonella sp.]